MVFLCVVGSAINQSIYMISSFERFRSQIFWLSVIFLTKTMIKKTERIYRDADRPTTAKKLSFF